MIAFKKIRPLHLFVASLVALALSTVAGVLFGSNALAIIPIEAPIALVGAWLVAVVARNQTELHEQQRDAYDSRLRATAAEAAQLRQMNRADEVSRHLRITETVESELALYGAAIVAAGRAAGAIGDREVTEPAQIALLPGILAEEALNGNALRENIRALVAEAQAEGAPNAWVSTVRLLASLTSSEKVGAKAGFGAAPALLDLVGRVSNLKKELGIELEHHERIDTSAWLREIGKLAFAGLESSSRCGFCGSPEGGLAISSDARPCCITCSLDCPACETFPPEERFRRSPSDATCQRCAVILERGLTLQRRIAAVLSPTGDPVSAEWIARSINEHRADVGPTDPPVTAADVTREMGLWPRAIAVAGGKWRIK